MILWIIFACLSIGSGVVLIREGIQDRKKYQTSTGRLYYNSYGEYTKKKPSFWRDFTNWFLSVVLFGFIIIVIGSTVQLFAYTSDKLTHYEQESQWNIYAFSDNVTVGGRVYFLSARVEGNLYYYYLANSSHGQMVYKIGSSNTYLNYIPENETCYIQKYERVFNDTFWNKFFIPRILSSTDCYYVAYIPEGSVSNEFQVDLQ